MDYSIGEFAAKTGVSGYTLRYYEKEGLIRPSRTENGRRRYGEADIAWIAFIRRLKDTGMPIREIRTYARLRAEGVSTLRERMALLERHKTRVEETLATWREHLGNLNGKIEYYREEIEREEILSNEAS